MNFFRKKAIVSKRGHVSSVKRNRRFFLLSLTLLFLALSFANLLWYLPTQKSVEDSVSRSHLVLADNFRLQTTLFLNRTATLLENAADLVALEREEGEAVKILQRLYKTSPEFIEVSYVGVSGEEIVHLERYPIFSGESEGYTQGAEFDHEEYIQEALSGEFVVSPVYLSSDLEPILDVYVPILFADEVRGALEGVVSVRVLSQIYEELEGGNMQAYLIDEQGFVLAHTDSSLVSTRTNVLEREVSQWILSGRVADGLISPGYVNEKGAEVFAVGIPLENGWGVVVEVEKELAFEGLRTLRIVALIMAVAVLLLGFLIVRSNKRIYETQNELKVSLAEAQKLAQIIEQGLQGVIITTYPDNTYSYVNKAWEDITGWKREEVIGKKTPKILKSDKHTKEFYEELNNTILSGEIFTTEMTNKKKDGTLYSVDASTIPLKDKEGNIIAFAEVSKDITDRKLAEEALKEQTTELEQTNKLMIGRELKMIELKKEIKELKEKISGDEPG